MIRKFNELTYFRDVKQYNGYNINTDMVVGHTHASATCIKYTQEEDGYRNEGTKGVSILNVDMANSSAMYPGEERESHARMVVCEEGKGRIADIAYKGALGAKIGMVSHSRVLMPKEDMDWPRTQSQLDKGFNCNKTLDYSAKLLALFQDE